MGSRTGYEDSEQDRGCQNAACKQSLDELCSLRIRNSNWTFVLSVVLHEIVHAACSNRHQMLKPWTRLQNENVNSAPGHTGLLRHSTNHCSGSSMQPAARSMQQEHEDMP